MNLNTWKQHILWNNQKTGPILTVVASLSNKKTCLHNKLRAAIMQKVLHIAA